MKTKEISHSEKIRKGILSHMLDKIDEAKAVIKDKKVARTNAH